MINFIKSIYDSLNSKITLLIFNDVEKKFIKLPYYKMNIIKKIKLSHIRHFLPSKYIYSKKYFIWHGNWYSQKISISSYKNYNLNYNSVFQIFEEKINYKKSDEYKKKLYEIKKNSLTTRGFKNIEDLDYYFESLLKLHRNMKKSGYKSQKEININSNDEIGVFISANGEIIKAEDKYGGTHRFALAKILKLRDVYINIRAVDQKFLKKHIYKNMISKDNELILQEKVNLFLNNYK
jgi:hypothetical protein